MYVNFIELKKSVSITQVLDAYGIQLKKERNQLRGPCPICGSDSKRAFVVTPSEGLWHCFKCDDPSGGDIISLVERLLNLRPKEAARDIQQKCLNVTTEEKADKPKGKLKPLSYLQAEHETVQELGIPAEVATKLGCGYSPKGIMRGRVAFPLRDENGKLIAYCGYSSKDGTLKLPTF